MTDRIYILDQGRHSPTLVTDLSETFWTEPASFARTGATTFTVTDNATNQALFKRYKPVRFKEGANPYKYAVVLSYATGTVTLGGAALPDPTDTLEAGPSYKTTFLHINVTGSMIVTANALNSTDYVRSKLLWTSPEAHLVHARAYVAVAASGANLLVNIAKNTLEVLTLNLGTATTVVGSSSASTDYVLAPDDDIGVEIAQIGSTLPGEDLSVYLVVVCS